MSLKKNQKETPDPISKSSTYFTLIYIHQTEGKDWAKRRTLFKLHWESLLALKRKLNPSFILSGVQSTLMKTESECELNESKYSISKCKCVSRVNGTFRK